MSISTGESPEADGQAGTKGRASKNSTSDKRKEQVSRLDFAPLSNLGQGVWQLLKSKSRYHKLPAHVLD